MPTIRPHVARPSHPLRALPAPAVPALLVVAALVGLVPTGCGTVHKLTKKVPTLLGGKAVMEVCVSEELNDSSPVPVDLLVVYDKEVLKMLGKVSAHDWFRGGIRKQFFKDHPQKAADAWHWEWVPGQVVAEQRLPYRTGVQGGLIFADYFFPGDHRAEVDLSKPFLLHLAEKGFTVEPLR
jgi:hypothetical protein